MQLSIGLWDSGETPSEVGMRWRRNFWRKINTIVEEIFKMSQDDESLEDYVERFQYNLQRTKKNILDHETLCIIFLKRIWEDCIDTLNLMGVGDISLLINICKIFYLCNWYSRESCEYMNNSWDTISRISRSNRTGVAKVELGKLLKNFKTNICSTLSSQLDTQQVKMYKEEAMLALAIFCSKCWKKHPLRECPLNGVEIYRIC